MLIERRNLKKSWLKYLHMKETIFISMHKLFIYVYIVQILIIHYIMKHPYFIACLYHTQ